MKTSSPSNHSSSQDSPGAQSLSRTIAAARSALDDRVQPVPPRHQGPRVAFAETRLGWLTREALVLLAMRGEEPDKTVPLGTGRGVIQAGASLLAVGQAGVETVYRVSPTGAVERWPAVLPITPHGIVRLFPGEVATQQGLWVVGRDSLQPMALRLRGPAIELGTPLPVGSSAPPAEQLEVARLASGAFLWAHGAMLTWIGAAEATVGPSKSAQLPPQLGSAVVIAASPGAGPSAQSPRGERLWIGTEQGRLALLQLDATGTAAPTARLLSFASLKPEDHRVHTLAAQANLVAAVLLTQETAGQQPVWNVAVFSSDGHETFRAALPWQPLSSEESDVSLALSSTGDRLAAASATRLVVWDLATRRVLAERPDTR